MRSGCDGHYSDCGRDKLHVMNRKLVPHHSHWGAFSAVVEDGRVVGAVPFELRSRPLAADRRRSRTRCIRRPASPRRWCARGGSRRGRRAAPGRGREPFVPVGWERALDLVAGELARVRREHGPRRDHGRLAGLVVGRHLPRGARTIAPLSRRLRRLCRPDQQLQLRHRADLPAAYPGQRAGGHRAADLVVVDRAAYPAFGACSAAPTRKTRRSPKAAAPGTARAAALDGAGARRRSRRQHQPDPRRRARGGRARMDRDPAQYRHGDDAGAGAHADQRAAATTRPSSPAIAPASTRVLPYLTGEATASRKTPPGRRRSPASRPRRSARLARRHGGDAHDADRVLVVAARRSWRAALLGAGAAWRAASARSGCRAAGSALAMARRRARRAAAALPRPGDADDCPIRHGSRSPPPRIADCLLNPGERYDYDGKSATYPDIRLVYWAGGNPFHHHQDLNRLRRAWQRPETIIVHEPWWTATARHADIVLPATTSLERNDIGGAPRDRFVIAMHKAIDPVGEARNDFDIFRDLAAAPRLRRRIRRGPRRDGVAAPPLRHFPRARAEQPGPRVRRVLGKGLGRNTAPSRRIRAAGGFPRRPRGAQTAHAFGADRALFRRDRRLRL